MNRVAVLTAVALLGLAGVSQPSRADTIFQATGLAGALGTPNYGIRADGFYDNNPTSHVTMNFRDITFTNDVTFTEFSAGGAELKGTVRVNRSLPNGVTPTYNMDIVFHDAMTPMGGNPNFRYFLITPTQNQLVNTADPNDFALLTSHPADGSMPFQVGVGANQKNGNFGAAGWFDWVHVFDGNVYSSEATGKHGDFVMNMNPVPEPSIVVLGVSGLVVGMAFASRRRRTSVPV